MIKKEAITGLILAGGRAQRMGGIDKGLISFQGKPLIDCAITRLKEQVGPIMINANRNITKYSVYGYAVIADETPDFAGPLAGFLAGLKAAQTPYLLTSPCDSPLLPIDLAQMLAVELEKTNAQLVYASTKSANGRHWAQPVFCLMRSDLADSLRTFLSKGDLKIDHWFTELRTSTVVFENEDAFANVNTPEELHALENAAK